MNTSLINGLVLLSCLTLTGCAEVALWGNLFSFLLASAIFFGTLTLSRKSNPGRTPPV